MTNRGDFPARYLVIGGVSIDTQTDQALEAGHVLPWGRGVPLIVAYLALHRADGAGRDEIQGYLASHTAHYGIRTVSNKIGEALRLGQDLGWFARSQSRAPDLHYRPVWSSTIEVAWRHSPSTDPAPTPLGEGQAAADRAAISDSEARALWPVGKSIHPAYITSHAMPLADMQLVWANPAFRWMWGHGDPLGRDVGSIIERILTGIHPDDHERVINEQITTLAKAEAGAEFVTLGPFRFNPARLNRFRRPADACGDQWFDAYVCAYPAKDGSGAATHWTCQWTLTEGGTLGAWCRLLRATGHLR